MKNAKKIGLGLLVLGFGVIVFLAISGLWKNIADAAFLWFEGMAGLSSFTPF